MERIVLDTNVLSELMRPRPERAVMEWFAGYENAVFYLSAITQAEILGDKNSSTGMKGIKGIKPLEYGHWYFILSQQNAW